MAMFILKRAGILAIMLVGVSIATFLLPYLTGQDPAAAILRARSIDPNPDPEVLANIRDEHGLDEPLPVQYFVWLREALGGNFGVSYVSREAVAPILLRALGISFTLASVTLVVALLIAIPLGVRAALRPGKAMDNLITVITQAGVAIPEYWAAPVLILVFALGLGWFPSAGWGGVAFIVLPVATLAIRPIAYFARTMRASMLDVLGSQYIVAAQARGCSYRTAVLRHGLKNAIIPVLALLSLWFAALLGGSFVVEMIFSIPGVGLTMYQAIVNSDLPIIQAGLMTILALAVIVTTVTDQLYSVLNPSIRVAGSSAP